MPNFFIMNTQSQNISAKYFPENFVKPYSILFENIAKLKASRCECIICLFNYDVYIYHFIYLAMIIFGVVA
jgi:hypothetical protein